MVQPINHASINPPFLRPNMLMFSCLNKDSKIVLSTDGNRLEHNKQTFFIDGRVYK